MLSLLRTRNREIQNLLFDITHYHRSKRGLGSLIGSGIAYDLGLATAKDVEEIQFLLREVLAGTQKAIDSWTVGQSLVTRITALSSKRFDNVDNSCFLFHTIYVTTAQFDRRRATDYMQCIVSRP